MFKAYTSILKVYISMFKACISNLYWFVLKKHLIKWREYCGGHRAMTMHFLFIECLVLLLYRCFTHYAITYHHLYCCHTNALAILFIHLVSWCSYHLPERLILLYINECAHLVEQIAVRSSAREIFFAN